MKVLKYIVPIFVGLLFSGSVGAVVTLPSSTKKGDLLAGSTTANTLYRIPTSTQGSVLWMGSNGLPAWTATSTLGISGGTGTPGGSNTQLQYNNSGAFGGIIQLTWNGSLLQNTATTTLATTTISQLTVSQSASIPALSNLTSNGFVKTSGGNGTLSIDTNTYLTTLATGTAGNIFNGSISSNTLTLNLPFASAANTGQLQAADWTTFNNKVALSYASSSYFTLWNTQAGSNITITTSSVPTIAVVSSPSFSGLTVTGQTTLATASSTGLSLTGALFNTASSTLATTTITRLNVTGSTTILSLGAANCDVKTENGNLYCGTDATGGGGTGSISTSTNAQVGKLAVWTGLATLGNSIVFDNGTVAGVNATSSTVSFNVRGSGTLNPFNVASSTGTSLMVVQHNGNTGIGSSSPNSTLVVQGPASGAVRQVFTIASSTNNQMFGVDSNGLVMVGKGGDFTYFRNILGTERLRIEDEDGLRSDVGLRVATNNHSVIAFGSSAGSLDSPTLSATSTTLGEFSGWAYGSTFRETSRISFTLDAGLQTSNASMPGRINFFTTPVGGIQPAATARMVINNQGNVGINTTTPLARLAVVNIATTTVPIFDLASSSGTSFLQVTALGNVGIGTATPNSLLQVAGNLELGSKGVASAAALVFNTGSTTNQSTIRLLATTTLSSSYTLTLPTTTPAAGKVLATDANGNLYFATNGGTSPTNFGGIMPYWNPGGDYTGAFAVTANNFLAIQVNVDVGFTLTKCMVNVTVLAAGSTAYCGLYSGDGQTLLSSGAASSTATGVLTMTMSSYTVAPGTYWIALSNTSGLVTLASMTMGTNGRSLMTGGTNPMGASASNTMSGGTFPSSLGTLTGSTLNGVYPLVRLTN